MSVICKCSTISYIIALSFLNSCDFHQLIKVATTTLLIHFQGKFKKSWGLLQKLSEIFKTTHDNLSKSVFKIVVIAHLLEARGKKHD